MLLACLPSSHALLRSHRAEYQRCELCNHVPTVVRHDQIRPAANRRPPLEQGVHHRLSTCTAFLILQTAVTRRTVDDSQGVVSVRLVERDTVDEDDLVELQVTIRHTNLRNKYSLLVLFTTDALRGNLVDQLQSQLHLVLVPLTLSWRSTRLHP